MAKWHRELTEEENDDIEIELTNPDPEDKEEKTWKKRYSDLRSHSQKQTNDLTARVKGLETQLQQAAKDNMKLPKTPDEIKAWAETYPDVAAIVRTIAIEENTKSREEFDRIRGELEEDRLKNLRDKATQDLNVLHPDFFTTIRDSEEFETWLSTKSKVIKDALYENDTDAQSAADVISLYKAESGFNSTKRQNNSDAARRVKIGSERQEAPAIGGNYEFTESQINAMRPDEFEKNEAAIDEARSKGKILLDLTGAAR